MPSDFTKQVLLMLQTTSVDKFNKVFSDEIKNLTRTSDREGRPTQWPALESVLTLATNTYKRLESEWTMTPAQKKSALSAASQVPDSTRGAEFKCFNCETNCGLKGKATNCKKKPIDHERIERNRKAFLDAKKKHSATQGKAPGGSSDKRTSRITR